MTLKLKVTREGTTPVLESVGIMQRALEQSPLSIVITDCTGLIEYVNARFTASTGYSMAEVLGRNQRFLKTGVAPAGVYRTLWETIGRGEGWAGELLNRKKNGDRFWESVRIAPLTTPCGEITHFLAVKEEIAGRTAKEPEPSPARDTANDAGLPTAAYLSRVSCEIRTPLSGVIGMAELLQNTVLTGEQAEYVRELSSSAQALLSVIDALPQVPAREAGAPREQSVPDDPPEHPVRGEELFDCTETLARMDGDWELFREVAGLFAASSREMMAEIGAAIGTGDPKRAGRAAHALKGTIANFGARLPLELALQLELLGKSGTLTGAWEKFAALETELGRLREALLGAGEGGE